MLPPTQPTTSLKEEDSKLNIPPPSRLTHAVAPIKESAHEDVEEEVERRVSQRIEAEKRKERANISQELIDYIGEELEQRAQFFTF
jgi:hypothetical protein